MADVQSELVMDSLTSAYIKAKMEVQLSSSFVFKNGVIFKLGNSPQYPLIKWENKIAGDWSELYLEYRKKDFSVLLGRWHNKWGYSDRYSLVLNDTLPARNGFWIRTKIDRLSFEYFVSSESSFKVDKAIVPRNLTDTLKPGEIIQRTLIGHRLEWSTSKIGMYFAEIAYCPSEGYLPNPKYLNPFFLYFLFQFNDAQLNSGIGVDANIIWDLGAFVKFKNVRTYGELLIDDFQYEEVPTKEPPQIGFLVGIDYKNSNFAITAEYTRIWAWTYLHENPWERYETLGYPLGHPYGPDFDELFFRIKKNFGKQFLTLNWEISYRRKGEPNMETEWPVAPQGDWNEFPPGSDFLWGTIERVLINKVKVTFKINAFKINCGLGLEKYWNWRHEDKVKKNLPVFYLGLEYISS